MSRNSWHSPEQFCSHSTAGILSLPVILVQAVSTSVWGFEVSNIFGHSSKVELESSDMDRLSEGNKSSFSPGIQKCHTRLNTYSYDSYIIPSLPSSSLIFSC